MAFVGFNALRTGFRGVASFALYMGVFTDGKEHTIYMSALYVGFTRT